MISTATADCDETNPAVGDLGPEGVIFIPAHYSPTRKPLLAVGNEVSGTTSIFEGEVKFERKNRE